MFTPAFRMSLVFAAYWQGSAPMSDVNTFFTFPNFLPLFVFLPSPTCKIIYNASCTVENFIMCMQAKEAALFFWFFYFCYCCASRRNIPMTTARPSIKSS